jgi:putative protein-disulfide isomerase
MTPRLLYVVDPMCSWCYGFKGALAEVSAELRADVAMELVMGGLAPDSDAPMDAATRGYVQQAWHSVSSRTGATFNHDFWTACAPRRSTYPACRAVILARELGKGFEMVEAIQRAYYCEARNPSDASTLVELATELEMDAAAFREGLESPRTAAALKEDLALRDRLGVSSYPSLCLVRGEEQSLVASGYLSAEELRAVLGSRGLLR